MRLSRLQHVRQVAAEHAPVGVKLVDDDVAEVLEQVHPLGVMRQDPRVEHVRVGQHEVGPRAHRAPRVLRRVPVVGVHPHVGERLRELHQLGQLILRQRLGWEEIQDAGLGLLDECLEHRQVVAERLAGRGRRHDDQVLALGDRVVGLGLVRVELLDASDPERFEQARIERRGKRRKDRGLGFEVSRGGDEGTGAGGSQETIEDLLQRHGSSYV